MDIYQQNLLALKTTNLPLANKLEKIKQNQTFEVYANTNLNDANILDLRDNSPIYTQQPLVETEEKLKKFKTLHMHRYLYFFGIGNGYFYKQLLNNPIHKKIYIIELELELIYIALNLIDLSGDILSGRIYILHSKDINYPTLLNIFNDDEKLYFKVYNLDIYSPYYEKYHNEIVKINGIFMEVFKHYINAAGNDCNDEITGLSHFLQNLPIMLKNPSLQNLSTKGTTTDTCIIVATGPSLLKQLPLLKKIQDYVTIISADSSLPILSKEGIKPDIATTIERNELLSTYYKKTPTKFLKGIVIALTSVVHQDLLDSVKGLTLQLSMRPTGNYYKYFNFDDWGYIGEGMSTANMAYELASKMKFKRIVLIGQDLSFAKDGSSHPKSHVFGSNNHANDKGAGEMIEAYGGNGKVKTILYWKLFLNGYIKAIEYNNRHTNIKTINSTEGGARIYGTTEMSFTDVIDKYISTDKKKEKIALDYPAIDEYQQNLHIAIDKLENVLTIGRSMRKRVEKILTTNSEKINKHKDINRQNIIKHNKMINKMINDIKTIRTKYYADSFNFFTHLLSPLIMHIEFDLAKIHVMPENNEEDKLIKNWETILVHHEWFLRVYANLEAILKTIADKKTSIEKSLNEELEIA